MVVSAEVSVSVGESRLHPMVTQRRDRFGLVRQPPGRELNSPKQIYIHFFLAIFLNNLPDFFLLVDELGVCQRVPLVFTFNDVLLLLRIRDRFVPVSLPILFELADEACVPDNREVGGVLVGEG